MTELAPGLLGIAGSLLGCLVLLIFLPIHIIDTIRERRQPPGRTGYNARGHRPLDPALTLGPVGQQHLHHTLTPNEYRALNDALGHHGSIWGFLAPPEAVQAYWQALPNYVIARCPFCEAPYTARLDTYSRQHWLCDDAWNAVFGPSVALRWFPPNEGHDQIAGVRFQEVGCRHFFSVETFLYPPQKWPDRDRAHLQRHIPYVIETCVPDDIPSVAVLHSLPICRPEEDRFVPASVLYMVSYYSEAGATVWKRRADEEDEIGARAGEYWAVLLRERGRHAYDLGWWVAQGKLQWLDLESPDLPLRSGPPESFPYVQVPD